MKLIIVESPTKARTLSRFLGGAFSVEASMGHVRDLPKSTLGVDVEHDFAPTYIIPKDKQKHVTELKKLAKKAELVILATDPDREGEAIAWHIAQIIDHKQLARITFHEITESAIQDALKKPGVIDTKLVDAQQARRVLDRLVGYTLSPLLWKKLSKRWLSAGRVQSVAVRLIVEREREIEKFTKEEYWTVEGIFGELKAPLVSHEGNKYEETLKLQLFDGTYTTTRTSIHSEEEAKRIIADFAVPFTVSAVDKKQVRRSPQPPYTTSTLQQDAGRRLYFSSKKTMQLAQKLYEEGYISYHRTDSVNLSDKFVTEARQYLGTTYGARYVPSEARRYKTKSKVAQEAHEAIRPTNVSLPTLSGVANAEVNRDHHRLYELIWKRAVACQSADAVFDATSIDITSENGYLFETSGSVVTFDGYLAVTGRDSEESVIPNVVKGQTVGLTVATPVRHETAPPPRYSEASLVKTLEEKGIGRPSTYAPIISTIIDRQYVTREEKRLMPTELGKVVTDFLVANFAKIMELPFTALLEDDLDAIANGEKQWVPVIASFYKPFAQDIDRTYKETDKVRLSEEKIDEKCPNCGHDLVIRMGRFGKFIACTNFPDCTFTKQYGEKVDMKCPRCGGDIVVKRSKRGKKFYGCSNYPTCTFAAWKKEDIKKSEA